MKKIILLSFISILFVANALSQNLRTAISAIGCKQIKVSNLKPTSLNDEQYKQWLKELKVQSKLSFIAKCGGYRYLFEEESYTTAEDAQKRYLRKLPPKENGDSDFTATILFREGFKVENKVYTVGAFTPFPATSGYVSTLSDKLEKRINR